MIEVERKFHVDEEAKKRLLKDAELIGTKTYTDVYYDTPDYKMTANDWWLRSRAGKFELKISLNRDITRQADQYKELETEAEIREAIQLPASKSFLEDLAANGYTPVCVCTTTRESYKKGDFSIDIDEVRYKDDSTYSLVEIELMVSESSQMEEAVGRIMEFAKEQQLDCSAVGGKVHYYIKHFRPEHFALLVKLKVLRDL